MEPIRSVYENDPEMVALVRTFTADAPKRAQSLEDLLSQGQHEELRRIAHQLKGAGGGYGFPQITDAAARLEEALKEDAEESVIKERTSILCEVLRAVRVGEEGS
jgi:HPt (histidine-containing phosphotransfer) domain-containing protein